MLQGVNGLEGELASYTKATLTHHQPNHRSVTDLKNLKSNVFDDVTTKLSNIYRLPSSNFADFIVDFKCCLEDIYAPVTSRLDYGNVSLVELPEATLDVPQ